MVCCQVHERNGVYVYVFFLIDLHGDDNDGDLWWQQKSTQ